MDLGDMSVRTIAEGIYWVGAIDWGRQVFDELIPLPDGTTYNAYLVRGSEKTVLIDTVDPEKEEELITNLMKLGVGSIDYVVVNHAEQDHSGSLPMILHLYPMATVLTTEKGKDLVVKLLGVSPENVRVVKDGETLSLGDRTLEFLITPWVHWPDTMLTYLQEERILFSCDLFGTHYATSELFVTDERMVYQGAKRYYAEIMMPFRKSIQGYLDRVSTIGPRIIAPSHGPIYDRPEMILENYRGWVSDNVKNMVLIPYVSMHGSTAKMVNYLTRVLVDRGIEVMPFDLGRADIGKLAMALVDAATIVIGTPTVLFGPHPKVAYTVFLANMLRPKARCVSIIGSYGWGGKTVQTITEMVGNFNAEFLEPVYIRGLADESDYQALDQLAEAILEKHREYGVVKASP
jgi:flavorubredoxin